MSGDLIAHRSHHLLHGRQFTIGKTGSASMTGSSPDRASGTGTPAA